MATLKGRPSDIIEMLDASLQAQLEELVLSQLKKTAEPMLLDMAKGIAGGIKANIEAYERADNREFIIVLRMDGVDKLKLD